MKKIFITIEEIDLDAIIEDSRQEEILKEITLAANKCGLTLEWFEFCLEHPELKTWEEKAAVFRNEWDI